LSEPLGHRIHDAFNQDLLQFLQQSTYVLITVVIDKKAHTKRYGAAALNPYHYCLAARLEHYYGFMNFYNAKGDIMTESRGSKEDRLLTAGSPR
jgi:hypothetical protein